MFRTAEPAAAGIYELNTLPSALDPAVHPLHKARVIVEQLAGSGIAPEHALAGTGIQARDLDNFAARMSIRQLMGVFRNACALTDDPMFALRAGKSCHLSVLGYFGLIMMTARCWAESIVYFPRYRPLSTPVLGVSFSASGDDYIMSYFDALDIEPGLFNFVLEFHMGMGINFQRDLYGDTFNYKEVRLTCPRPPHAAAIEALFETPVVFGAEDNQLVWDVAWLEQRFVHGDALSNQGLAQICDQLCAQIAAASGKAGVVTCILERSAEGFPTIDEVATRMNVTSRTLRRWLLAEGTSYAAILDAVRVRTAIHCLRATHMKMDDISARLGFTTTASFRTAFRRWTGRQPSHYRPHSHARGAGPSIG